MKLTMEEMVPTMNGVVDLLGESYFLTKLRGLKNYSEFDVTIEYRNRLDLIAYKVYENVELWWIIAYYNNIVNPLNFTNLKLKIPSYTDLVNIGMETRIKGNLIK